MERLSVALEAAPFRHQLLQRPFAGMPKRRMAKIVRETTRLHEIAIEGKIIAQGAADCPEVVANRAADLRDFHGVGQAGTVEIVFAREKNLRLRLQLPKSMRVDDPVTIDLKCVAVIRLARCAEGLAIERVVEPILHQRVNSQEPFAARDAISQ